MIKPGGVITQDCVKNSTRDYLPGRKACLMLY
jgi:hypothetical protein